MSASLVFVQLFVRDWASAVGWYRDVLGLRVVLSVAEERFALLAAGGGCADTPDQGQRRGVSPGAAARSGGA